MPSRASSRKSGSTSCGQRSRHRRRGGSRYYRETGSDLLAMTSIGPTVAAQGKGIFLTGLNPNVFPGTRWAQQAQLWSRWRPISMRLRLSTGQSVAASGNHGIGWVADPTESFPTGIDGIRKLSAMRPSSIRHIHETASISIPSGVSNMNSRWLNVEPGENGNHGTVAAIVVNQPTTQSGTINWSLYLDWTCEFDSPEMPHPSSETLYAEEGYQYYFTDSVSDWENGAKLTLKARSGGGVVPFPTAVPGQVYKLEGVVLAYYSSSSQTASLQYGVLIKDYYVKGLAVFSSASAAQNYARASSPQAGRQYLLNYFAPGARCTQSNPGWAPEGDPLRNERFHLVQGVPGRPNVDLRSESLDLGISDPDPESNEVGPF